MEAPFELWRRKNELSYKQLAELLGVPQAVQARRYCIGQAMPRPEMISKIIGATKGTITADDLHRGCVEFAAKMNLKGRSAA